MLDPNLQAAHDKRLSILPLLAVVISLCFTHIHQGTLSIDGIRYASIASYIGKTGELFRLVDDYSGVAYANKPPVLFWLVALSFKVFGFSTFAAKLPGAIFAALAMTVTSC